MKYIALLAALFLAACSVTPTNPGQGLAQVETNYNLAVAAAATYASLPPCGSGILVCSDVNVVKKIKVATDAAEITFHNAEVAVLDPSFGKDSIATAIVAAQAAVNLLTALTPATGAKR